MFLANGKAGWGRDLEGGAKTTIDKGKIPPRLENPTN